MSLYLGENKIADNTCSRNIGEIVASTIPLSDAGLHLLDGALISNVGSYAKFVNYIAGLVTDYPDLFETEANWQNAVTTYGVCGKFVYDSTNNTVRLPKITGFTEGTIDPTTLGDLTTAGLPNITGDTGLSVVQSVGGIASGALYPSGSYTNNGGSGSAYGASPFAFDASRSSSIYGNSSTVQPQSIKVLYYIVIASSITNELNLDVADMATKSLDNLDNIGKNIANWSSNVTNCITEIPQDIKLELNDGTLTLKAGSKVYVPNGFESDGTTPKFDEVVTTSDISVIFDNTLQKMLFVNLEGPYIWHCNAATMTASGSTAPSLSYGYWYDTTNNLVKFTSNGSTWSTGFSFPICLATGTDGTVTSIDQVFNGFGYIGSTVFALPGVKGLIPNGRNEDGTLKNTEFVLDGVVIRTDTTGTDNFTFALQSSKSFTRSLYFTLSDDNYLYNSANQKITGFEVFKASQNNGVTTSLTPKSTFHALDYNDSSTISGWAMPSSKYIDLTLGASGTQYTAPANGWVFFQDTGNQSYSALVLRTNYIRVSLTPGSGGNGIMSEIMPVKKGDIFYAEYANITGENRLFRFVYAEGEN